MKPNKLFALFLLFLVLIVVGCDNDSNSNAQDGGTDPGPIEMGGMTTFTGKAVAQGNTSCSGGIGGIVDGDNIEVTITRTVQTAGNAMLQVNGGADGMFSCSADGQGIMLVDTPPITNIICSVDSVSNDITGVMVGDTIQMFVAISGEDPVQKEAGIIAMGSSCLLVQLDSFNAQQQ